MLSEYLVPAFYLLEQSTSQLLLNCALLFIAVPFFTIILHEAGHYYAAKLVSVNSTNFSIGQGLLLFRMKNKQDQCWLEFRAYLLAGRVTYHESFLDLPPHKKAFMAAGGWLAEALIFIFFWLIHNFVSEPNPVVSLMYLNSIFRIIYVLSPLTSDGRRFVAYTMTALANLFAVSSRKIFK